MTTPRWTKPGPSSPTPRHTPGAVQFHPNGVQFGFVWLPARTMHTHGAYVWGAQLNLLEYPPEYICPALFCDQAIAVNQAWFGSPGQLLASRDASRAPDAHGFLNYSGSALMAGDDIKVETTTVAEAEAWCGANDACAGVTFNSSAAAPGADAAQAVPVYFKGGIVLEGNREWSSLIKVEPRPKRRRTAPAPPWRPCACALRRQWWWRWCPCLCLCLCLCLCVGCFAL